MLVVKASDGAKTAAADPRWTTLPQALQGVRLHQSHVGVRSIDECREGPQGTTAADRLDVDSVGTQLGIEVRQDAGEGAIGGLARDEAHACDAPTFVLAPVGRCRGRGDGPVGPAGRIGFGALFGAAQGRRGAHALRRSGRGNADREQQVGEREAPCASLAARVQ
jgi:hypothetical protein